jgi:hypothetical protein
VFAREDEAEFREPRYSDSLSLLDHTGLAILRTRIAGALGSDAKSVEMAVDRHGPGSAFDHFCRAFAAAADEEFLAASRDLTSQLARAQRSRGIPGGVVLVVDGQVGIHAHPFVAVVKADFHEGFVREPGDHGPVIKLIKDLLLTPSQRFHKIGILVRDVAAVGGEVPDPTWFSVRVFDSRMVGSEITHAATYFYDQFLGCRVAPTAPKLTRDFYNHTRSFIQQAPLGDEKKVEAVTALNTYLRSERHEIHPVDFAQDYLPEDQRDAYLNHLEDSGFPEGAVQKDTSLIKSKLRIRKMSFTSDVVITAPAERFDELIHVESRGEGETLVRVRGNVTRQN